MLPGAVSNLIEKNLQRFNRREQIVAYFRLISDLMLFINSVSGTDNNCMAPCGLSRFNIGPFITDYGRVFQADVIAPGSFLQHPRQWFPAIARESIAAATVGMVRAIEPGINVCSKTFQFSADMAMQ